MNNIQIAKGLQAISEGIALIAGAMVEGAAKETAEQLPLVAQTETKEEKPKRERKKKEEKVEAASAPATEEVDAFTESAPVSAPAPVVEAAKTEAPAVQLDESTLRNKLVEFAQKHGKDRAYSILAKFDGAKKVNELKPENMPKVYSELQAGL